MLCSYRFSKSAHSEGILFDGLVEAQLRKPRVVPDDQFVQRLAVFLKNSTDFATGDLMAVLVSRT